MRYFNTGRFWPMQINLALILLVLHIDSLASSIAQRLQRNICDYSHPNTCTYNVVDQSIDSFLTSIDVLPSKNQGLCEFCTRVNQLKQC